MSRQRRNAPVRRNPSRAARARRTRTASGARPRSGSAVRRSTRTRRQFVPLQVDFPRRATRRRRTTSPVRPAAKRARRRTRRRARSPTVILPPRASPRRRRIADAGDDDGGFLQNVVLPQPQGGLLDAMRGEPPAMAAQPDIVLREPDQEEWMRRGGPAMLELKDASARDASIQNLRLENERADFRVEIERNRTLRGRGDSPFALMGEMVFSFSDVRGVGVTEITTDYVRAGEELASAFMRSVNMVIAAQWLQDDDRIQVYVTDGTVRAGLPLLRVRDWDPRRLWDRIMASINSAQALNFSTTRVYVKFVRKPAEEPQTTAVSSTGHVPETNIPAGDVQKALRRFKAVSLISTRNGRKDCMWQCLGMAVKFWEKESGDEDASRVYRLTRQKTGQGAREKVAGDVITVAGFGSVYEPVKDDELDMLEDKLGMNIHMIDGSSFKFIRIGSSQGRGLDVKNAYCVVEQFDEGRHAHYVEPTKVHTLFGKRKLCTICMRGYADISHTCLPKCAACYGTSCVGVNQDVKNACVMCEECNLGYFDEACLQRHIIRLCKRRNRCKRCQVIYEVRKRYTHRCGHYQCTNCLSHIRMGDEHYCYMSTLSPEDIAKPSHKYVYYDYECTVDEVGNHEVAGVVAMYHTSEEVYKFQLHDEFIDWVLLPRHREYTFIAHNAARYDMHFVKRELLARHIDSRDIVNGNRIMACTLKKEKIRFLDSYLHIPMGLRKFPKTFGISSVSKGYFPYRFFTPENKFYVGPMPPLDMFDFHLMSEGERAKAESWYELHRNDEVNLFEMCMEYCVDDVRLLRTGCRMFQKIFMEITDDQFDPFAYITIASVCMALYRRFHMPEKQIGVLHVPEYASEERNQWEQYVRRLGMELKLSQTQPRVGRLAESDAGLYMFAPCLHIGCTRCYNDKTKHPLTFIEMKQIRTLFNQHVKRAIEQEFGRPLTVMRLCEWRKKLQDESSVRAALGDVSTAELPLSIRDGFFGGRTEPIKLYYKVKPGEKILYYDYTSLYPSTQFGLVRGITNGTQHETRKFEFPIGHPIRVLGNFGPVDSYFGLIKCRITPPDDLYLPVLPEKKDGKLVFDLTPKVGTWTTIEVSKALECGYVIDEIYEVLHWEQRSCKLFRDYVRKFLKLKLEASGWSKFGCETEEEKDAFRAEVWDVYGIKLGKVENNPGKYAIAKLCLNSNWGKFSQRDNYTETMDTYNNEDFYDLVFNDQHEVSDVFFHSASARTVCYKTKKEFISIPKTTNIAIAAYTTAHARLRLYEALEELGEKVLYMDTDSVIFVSDGTEDILCGRRLGDLTDELDGGEHIVEFMSTGPKSYAYVTSSGKEVMKVKGFTLNASAREHMTIHAMRDMVCKNHGKVITVRPLQFDISESHTIKTKQYTGEEGKKFSYTFDKRVVLPFDDDCIDTLPHGYAQ